MEEHTHKNHKNNLAIPIAIVIAGVMIGGAVIFSNKNTNNNLALTPEKAVVENKGDLDQMMPITKEDHIRGDPNAPVKIVEYSDTECPFCKRFHNIMKQVMEEYGKDGKVAWVYRHFPLDQLHPIKARNEATAFECANEQGGNDKFWQYADRLYEVTPSNNGLDSAELPKIAQYVGLNVSKFNTCLSSGKYDQHIQDDLDNAMATGGQGTPWSIIVGPNGKKYPLSGAQPVSVINQLIDLALQEK
ncbi:MAG: disulfide bond formation protein DsbA [Candidatus Zambryskibacteria bacterium]|nr:disulfide bond formation protein DsbA [Candidatus Zambryskibacteria bacterium]